MNFDGVSCPEIGLLFYSVGWGPTVRAVRVFCGWNLEDRRSSWGGGAWPLVWLKGLLYTLLPHFPKFPNLLTICARYFSLLHILFTFLFLSMSLYLVTS